MVEGIVVKYHLSLLFMFLALGDILVGSSGRGAACAKQREIRQKWQAHDVAC